jgi:hypothetical protein
MLAILESRRWLLAVLSLAALVSAIGLVGDALAAQNNGDLSNGLLAFLAIGAPSASLGLGLLLAGLALVVAAAASSETATQRDRGYLFAVGTEVVLIGIGFFLVASTPRLFPFRVGWLTGGLGSLALTTTLLILAKEHTGKATGHSRQTLAQCMVVAGAGCCISLVFWGLVAATGEGWSVRWFWGTEACALSFGVLAVACFVAARAATTSSLRFVFIGLSMLAIGVALFGTAYRNLGWIPFGQGRHAIITGSWLMGIGCAALAIAPGIAALRVRRSPTVLV